MAEYTIEWVGDEPRTYQGTNSWNIAGKDAAGTEFKKTKLEIPEAAGKPKVGQTVQGDLIDHPKLAEHGVRLLELSGDATVAANGSTPSEATGSLLSPSNARSGEDTRTDQINRSVAFKAAVSFLCRRDLDKKANVNEIRSLTEALLPIVTGEADPKDVSPPETQTTPNPEDLF